MPKNIVKRSGRGDRDVIPEVLVENIGDYAIAWECMNYSGDGNDVQFVLNPHEPEPFSLEYAKALFGDWTLDRSALEGRRNWAAMMSLNIRRFPGGYPVVSSVIVRDNNGVILWDGPKEYAEFIQGYAAIPGMLPKPVIGTPGRYSMPKILTEASQDQLRTLWESVFKCKMPGAMRLEDARGCLLPHLSIEQIEDVLAEERMAQTT